METWCIVIGFWILWPILCYNLAAARNRDTGAAVIWGIIFGLFAVLYYATASKIEKKEGG